MREGNIIRKAITVCLSFATLVTLALFVLSYTVKSKLDCFDPGNQPRPGFWIKDLPLAIQLRILGSVFDESAEVDGLLFRFWKSDDGDRTYLQAFHGSLVFSHFIVLDQPFRFLPLRKQELAGFAMEQQRIFGLWPEGWQLDQMTPEAQQWVAESFCDASVFRVPLWLPFVLFGVYPFVALVLIPLRRHRRRKRNQCIHCGYNLTGLPEPRCPECGKEI